MSHKENEAAGVLILCRGFHYRGGPSTGHLGFLFLAMYIFTFLFPKLLKAALDSQPLALNKRSAGELYI